MTKQEFLDGLRMALSGKVHHGVIQENISYYDTYISMQMKKGMSEEEVLASLGDPRLIAKTIINAEQFASGHASMETVDEGEQSSNKKKKGLLTRIRLFVHGILSRLPGWLSVIMIVLIAIVFMAVLSTVFTMVLAVLGPFMVPLLLAMMIVMVVRRFR